MRVGWPVGDQGDDHGDRVHGRDGGRLGTTVLGPSRSTVRSDAQITATAPAGSDATGAVNVRVVAPGGTSPANNSSDLYIYAPTITGISPPAGPPAGGTTVTLSGTGYLADGGVDVIIIAGKIITPKSVSDTQVTFVTPAASVGASSVTVLTPRGGLPGRQRGRDLGPDVRLRQPDDGDRRVAV